MADIRDVVDYFLQRSEEGTTFAITPLKLQKLVYYAQGFHLRDNPDPLFEEDLEAWDHGPVNRDLYYDFSHYRYFTIASEAFYNNNGPLLPNEIRTLDAVWEQYGNLDGKLLEELTHQEDPWLFTPRNHVINIEIIREYFANLLVAY
jgi:uncharacterized phage-associated protein